MPSWSCTGKTSSPEWQSQAYRDLYASCKGNFEVVAGKLFRQISLLRMRRR
ncbi:MAG: hypothetical protein MZV63_05020 [Marinilabiliales bacterium]|nr:hypothetical protein [Marinilabiliales bacterium]